MVLRWGQQKGKYSKYSSFIVSFFIPSFSPLIPSHQRGEGGDGGNGGMGEWRQQETTRDNKRQQETTRDNKRQQETTSVDGGFPVHKDVVDNGPTDTISSHEFTLTMGSDIRIQSSGHFWM
jgi:hypothetical protein